MFKDHLCILFWEPFVFASLFLLHHWVATCWSLLRSLLRSLLIKIKIFIKRCVVYNVTCSFSICHLPFDFVGLVGFAKNILFLYSIVHSYFYAFPHWDYKILPCFIVVYSHFLFIWNSGTKFKTENLFCFFLVLMPLIKKSFSSLILHHLLTN